jgi:hypothetical protein
MLPIEPSRRKIATTIATAPHRDAPDKQWFDGQALRGKRAGRARNPAPARKMDLSNLAQCQRLAETQQMQIENMHELTRAVTPKT